ncbi:MAG: hypothetical protein MUO21_08585, partial [Nitrososphaeraceae archaeon]|nr:hypothetical protein [Nitrososphaeraceae archaeon]
EQRKADVQRRHAVAASLLGATTTTTKEIAKEIAKEVIKEVKSEVAQEPIKDSIPPKPQEDIYKKLTKEQVHRVKTLLENKVNYISGTMCPAPCDFINNELESLKEALKYYYDQFKKGNVVQCETLLLECKYMGSRCNIYLFRDNPTDSYLVSRNGYSIKTLSKETVTKLITPLHNYMLKYMTDNKIKLMIIDSELLPWSAIGAGLIEKNFKTVDYAIGEELSRLQKYGFEEKYSELGERVQQDDFENKSKKSSKKELLEKFDQATFNTYRLYLQESKQHVPIGILEEKHKLYHEQLEIYAKEEEMYLAPFGILKMVYDDGTEKIPGIMISGMGQIEAYHLLPVDERVIINFQKKTFEECLEQATNFYEHVTKTRKMEGIVIKPNYNIPSVAPYIKVRNPDYLSIIYGYDYTTEDKYKKLMKQKNITRKMKASIDEFFLGIQMLNVKYDAINVNNTEYAKLLIKFLGLEESEKEIDPRL